MRIRPISLTGLLLLLLASCQRLPLELCYDGRADLHLTYDWTSRFGERPEGMTLMLAKDGDSIGYFDPTYRVDETTMRLNSGTYLLTVMNRTFGEYGSMTFFRRNSHNDIFAQANTYHITAERQWDNGRSYLQEPERIGVVTDTLTVTNTIDELHFYDYRDRVNVDTIHIERQEVVLPMTTTLTVRVKVRGYSYMRSVEGYITGMATGFWLNQRWRLTEVGTQRLDHWVRDDSIMSARKAEGESATNVGWIRCQVETFGLPHGRELLKWRTPESNYLLLHFTLIDGRTVDFSYYVGHDIRYLGDDGSMEVFYQTDVALELNLVIDAPFYDDDEVPIMPYAQPEGTGLFDAEVAPWGDEIDVELPV